jgi:hypothetical protein
MGLIGISVGTASRKNAPDTNLRTRATMRTMIERRMVDAASTVKTDEK